MLQEVHFPIFPGVGLASILRETREITEQILAASAALCESLSEKYLRESILFPSVRELRDISKKVAFSVIEVVEEEDVCKQMGFQSPSDLEKYM